MFGYFFSLIFLKNIVASFGNNNNYTSTSGEFQFRVKNAANNVYNLDCFFDSQSNYYDSSHVKTTTQPYNWVLSGSSWDLKYQRIDESHADGEL